MRPNAIHSSPLTAYSSRLTGLLRQRHRTCDIRGRTQLEGRPRYDTSTVVATGSGPARDWGRSLFDIFLPHGMPLSLE